MASPGMAERVRTLAVMCMRKAGIDTVISTAAASWVAIQSVSCGSWVRELWQATANRLPILRGPTYPADVRLPRASAADHGSGRVRGI